MLASTVLDYIMGLMLSRPLHDQIQDSEEIQPFNWDTILSKPQSTQQRQRWLILSLVGNLGILGVFKYYSFFTDPCINPLSTSNFKF